MFNIFKKPQREQKNINVEVSEQFGDWQSAFYFKNQAVIDLYDHQLHDCKIRSVQESALEDKIQPLLQLISLFESVKAWCSSRKDGDRFFEAHYGGWFERNKKELERIQYIVSTIRPGIIAKASAPEGVLQSELVKSFSIEPEAVRAEIRRLEEEDLIYKEKSGRSFIIKSR